MKGCAATTDDIRKNGRLWPKSLISSQMSRFHTDVQPRRGSPTALEAQEYLRVENAEPDLAMSPADYPDGDSKLLIFGRLRPVDS